MPISAWLCPPEHAAIDEDVGAGDVVRRTTRQERRHSRKIVGRSDATGSDAGIYPRHKLLVGLHSLSHGRIDKAWPDRIDLDVVLGPGRGAVLAELHNTRLSRTVSRPARTAHVGHHRANIEDLTATDLFHFWICELAQ